MFCNITTSQMQLPPSERIQTTPRTLQSLRDDLLKFQTEGKNDIKNAKEYNNVIDDVMFNVPIDQVGLITYFTF